MTIEWNHVTWYSKLLAVIVFVTTFVVAFSLGRQYESALVVNGDVSQVGGVPSTGLEKETTFTLNIGEEKTVKNGVFKLESVDDSRCPQDVQCIWAGTVKADLTFVSGGSKQGVTVEVGKNAVRLSEYNVSLLSVSPTKDSSVKTGYRFTFHIEPAF